MMILHCDHELQDYCFAVFANLYKIWVRLDPEETKIKSDDQWVSIKKLQNTRTSRSLMPRYIGDNSKSRR